MWSLQVIKMNTKNKLGTVVVVMVWYLELQLPVQSVPITTKVVSSNPFMVRFM